MTSIYVSVSLLAPTHGEFEYLGRAGRSEAVINGGEMHPFKRILLATMIVGAAACSQEEGNRTVATIQGVDIQQKEVDAYLRFKRVPAEDRKSTRLNSSHVKISYAVFCLKKKKPKTKEGHARRGNESEV